MTRRWLACLLLALGVWGCKSGSETRERPSAPVATAKRDAPPAAPVVNRDASAVADGVSGATPWVPSDGGVVSRDGSAGAALAAKRTKRIAAPLRGTHAENASVFVGFGEDAAVLIRRSLDSLKIAIPTDRRVVIKVNLGGFDNHGMVGRITSPAFVDALLGELRRRGVRDLVVADAASRSAKDMERVMRKAGYEPILARHKASFANLNHYGAGDARPAPWHMVLPWAKHLKQGLVLSNDLVGGPGPIYLINVPKLKAHRYAVMSLSIKNMMGAVMMRDPTGRRPAWRRRGRMHRELSRKTLKDMSRYRASLAVFSERLADLYGVLTPDLAIIEGMPPSQGNGFKHAIPYGNKSMIVVSRNGCYADYVAAEYFGMHDSAALAKYIGFRMPPAIQAVAKRFYGGVARLRTVKVVGDTAWRTTKRPTAWIQGMAKFEIGTRPGAPGEL